METLARRVEELAQELGGAREAVQARTDLLAMVSHEMRTPLNGILGISEILMDSGLNSEQKGLLTTVVNSGEALLAMVNDLLEASRIDSGTVSVRSEPFSLKDLVEAVGQTVAPRAQEDAVELTVFVDPSLPDTVEGDPHRLRQILVNLMGNAVKFTREGSVAMEVRGVGVWDEGSPGAGDIDVLFSVRDTGPGIPPEKLEAIFQPFVQLDDPHAEPGKGTGLGLGISRSLAHLLGGDLKVRSKVGEGSTFHVVLPLSRTTHTFPSRRASDRTFPEIMGVVFSPSEAVRRSGVASFENLGADAREIRRLEEMDPLLARIPESRPLYVVMDDALSEADRARAHLLLEATAQRREVHLVHLGRPGRWGCRSYEGPLPCHRILKPMGRRALATLLQETRESGGAEAGVPQPLPKPDADLTWQTILVVDDEAVNRELARRFLTEAGWRVRLAESGAEALEILGNGGIRGVLMDMELGDMHGTEVVRAIRRGEEGAPDGPAGIPILAVTGNAGPEVEARVRAAGCDGYLPKPFSRAALVEAVAALIPWEEEAEPILVPVPEIIADLAPAYVEERIRDLPELRRMVRRGDTEAVAEACHRIAGTAGTFGLRSLTHLAREMELALGPGHRDQLLEMVEEMGAYLERVRFRVEPEEEEGPERR